MTELENQLRILRSSHLSRLEKLNELKNKSLEEVKKYEIEITDVQALLKILKEQEQKLGGSNE